jgi:hypothetical protein
MTAENRPAGTVSSGPGKTHRVVQFDAENQPVGVSVPMTPDGAEEFASREPRRRVVTDAEGRAFMNQIEITNEVRQKAEAEGKVLGGAFRLEFRADLKAGLVRCSMASADGSDAVEIGSAALAIVGRYPDYRDLWESLMKSFMAATMRACGYAGYETREFQIPEDESRG